MRSFSAGLLTIFVFGGFVAPTRAQRPSPAPAPTRLQLTVDSIMRGPELVGWPPTQLRWSPDSQNLYFSWRKPGDKAEALYVVARGGGAPRRLSDEEANDAPPANGRWDAARRRLLATEGGDVVIYDGTAGTRTFVTRTTFAPPVTETTSGSSAKPDGNGNGEVVHRRNELGRRVSEDSQAVRGQVETSVTAGGSRVRERYT